MIKKIISIILLIIWCLVIYYFSSSAGSSSGSLSKSIITNILCISENSHYFNTIHLLVRKVAHFSEYAILGVITLNVLKQFNIKSFLGLYAISFCLLYAMFDEYHQTFINGRNGSIIDVLIDLSGVLVVYLIYILIKKDVYYGKG